MIIYQAGFQNTVSVGAGANQVAKYLGVCRDTARVFLRDIGYCKKDLRKQRSISCKMEYMLNTNIKILRPKDITNLVVATDSSKNLTN